MEWSKLEEELKLLSQKIDFAPDIIIGIVRGGMIPARLLSTYLKVKTVYCLTVIKKNQQRIIETEITHDLNNKKILLVEDMIESGKSLIEAKNYLETKGANVQTTCLYIMPISEIKPDYYLKTIDKPETFPWEK